MNMAFLQTWQKVSEQCSWKIVSATGVTLQPKTVHSDPNDTAKWHNPSLHLCFNITAVPP